jgi:hypothetical protein
MEPQARLQKSYMSRHGPHKWPIHVAEVTNRYDISDIK